ncbi:hypothetical protein QVD17_27473 [Tagetes erecta]|uniref:Uncharacterized protein n=1 Tax=Tagetes erecta TaxID=13708 RepID=A0AAD8KEW4_TARER|nr:hypothetical protein QVD17_27473 [Tagetes erecta]
MFLDVFVVKISVSLMCSGIVPPSFKGFVRYCTLYWNNKCSIYIMFGLTQLFGALKRPKLSPVPGKIHQLEGPLMVKHGRPLNLTGDFKDPSLFSLSLTILEQMSIEKDLNKSL